MPIPKRYGESRIETCPWCSKQAITKNKEGIPTCLDHKSRTIGEVKCACGCWLDIKQGKFGPFYVCENCGIVSLSKVLEMNPPNKIQSFCSSQSKSDHKPTETTVTSDEVDFL